MKSFVALLRAINVGGTGKLAMSELRKLTEDCGFEDVRTYIQSGNVVFRSKQGEANVKQQLEQAIERKMGKPFGVVVRSGADLQQVLVHNPYPSAEPNQLLVMFLDEAPPVDSLKAVIIPGNERLSLQGRELFIHFPEGIGKSKLKLPFQKHGTARNLNTVRKLAELAR